MSDAGTCTRPVNRGDYRWSRYSPCGRPAVDVSAGEPRCSLHKRVDEKRAAKATAMQEERKQGDRITADAERLSSQLGILVKAHYDWHAAKYSGAMIVPADFLERIAREGKP